MRYKRKFITQTDRTFFKLDREAIWKKQNKACFYCRQPLKRHEITFDHVIPLSKIKRIHTVSNCVVSCEACNTRKDSNPRVEFQDWEITLQQGLTRLERRTRQAMYKIIRYSGCEDTKGSFAKWERYWEKRGRF